MKASKWVVRLLTLALLTALGAAAAIAQVGTASITGTVTDQQGNAVAGATVKLLNNSGSSRTGTTNDNGVYLFPSVQTGVYRIDVEMAGFKKASV